MQQLTRRFIVLSHGGLQAVLLLMCVWMWSVWMQDRMAGSLAETAAEHVQRAVDQLSSEVAERGQEIAQLNSPAWKKMARRVRVGSGDDGSFLAIVDLRNNRLVHHSFLTKQLRENKSVQARELLLPPTSSSLQWQSTNRSGTVVGRRVKGSNFAVVAVQPRRVFEASAARLMGPLQPIGFFAALLTAISSGVMLSSVAKRYENKISNVNSELDSLVAEQMQEFTRTRDAIIYGLARLAESRDTDTGEHLDRIQYYSCLLAEKLSRREKKIDAEYVQKLRLASTLHDIGKVGIPDEILLKPGRLTDKERKIMQQHAVIGSQCLREIRERLGNDEFLDMAYNIASGHHEWWDGSGYPYGVAAEDIPLEARIVAVADVYDALRSRRVYKDSMSHEKAASIIREGAGTQFDPDIVAVFEQCHEEFESQSQQSSEEAEMCLLEKIRECLHESSSLEDMDAGLMFLQDAESDVHSRETMTT